MNHDLEFIIIFVLCLALILVHFEFDTSKNHKKILNILTFIIAFLMVCFGLVIAINTIMSIKDNHTIYEIKDNHKQQNNIIEDRFYTPGLSKDNDSTDENMKPIKEYSHKITGDSVNNDVKITMQQKENSIDNETKKFIDKLWPKLFFTPRYFNTHESVTSKQQKDNSSDGEIFIPKRYYNKIYY